ncbi:MAG: hypothetical protein PHX30_02575 [Candidatus Pacebacteria bacterium]|nr:hypothetical protein [Candidatus Paceibacterota bacterium]
MENDEKDFEVDNKKAEQSVEQGQENPIVGSAERVQAAVEEVKEDGRAKVKKIEDDGGTSGDIEEMQDAANVSAEGAEEAGKQYEEERSEEERLDLAEEYVEKNSGKIRETTEKICKKLGIEINSEEIKDQVVEKLAEALQDEELLKTLEEEGVIDEDTASSIIFLVPRIEKAIEAIKEGEGYEGKAKEVIKAILDDPEQDLKYINAAGEMLEKLSESGRITDKKMALTVKYFGLALQNGTVQRILSKKLRAWLEKEDDEGKKREGIVEEVRGEMDI